MNLHRLQAIPPFISSLPSFPVEVFPDQVDYATFGRHKGMLSLIIATADRSDVDEGRASVSRQAVVDRGGVVGAFLGFGLKKVAFIEPDKAAAWKVTLRIKIEKSEVRPDSRRSQMRTRVTQKICCRLCRRVRHRSGVRGEASFRARGGFAIECQRYQRPIHWGCLYT